MRDIKAIVQQMTLEEKASICSGADMWHLKGIDRLDIPSIMVTDGPHGLRKEVKHESSEAINLTSNVPATCFPTASALAANWNRDLVYEVGRALGEECLQEKVSVILGPGVNIKRSPLCGRNFEYFSEDPYLTGEMAKSHIAGVQSQGVGTSIKHFAVNNQETRRMTIDTIIDERTLREIYLSGFEMAVKGSQPWTVMCSYNRINGTFASDHSYLLNEILREEWGFEGLVVTDWGALNEPVSALDAGVDLEMPGVPNGNDAKIIAAVRSGDLEEAALNRAVERIVSLILKVQDTLEKNYAYDPDAHHHLARQAAREGVVLLKNENEILPISPDSKVALIGRFAKHPRYQGAGSSIMTPTRLDTLYDELVKLVGVDHLIYAPGYTEKGDVIDKVLILEAMNAAEQADVVIICAGLTDMYEIEGIDRTHMRLPAGHDELIQRIASKYKNVIVVLSNGSPVEMPWVDSVPAIVEGYLGGQAGAGAMADILVGHVNPSGKLAETFPIKFEDSPALPFPGGPVSVEYREGIYVGYRYYDTAKVDVLFPFGHGLSYTQFAYRDLNLIQSGNSVIASFKVANVGKRAGKETAQLYVKDLDSTIFRPDKELKGFVKVSLEPGEEKKITLELEPRAFAYYDMGSKEWVVEAGRFEIFVGASSRDIRLTSLFIVDQKLGTPGHFDKSELGAYFNLSRSHEFTKNDFEALLGYAIPDVTQAKKGHYTLNTPLVDMKDSFIARQLFRIINKQVMKMVGDEVDTPMGAMMKAVVSEMPLRGLMMSGQPFGRQTVEALLMIINGKLLKGIRMLFSKN